MRPAPWRDAKTRAVLERIRSIEDAISRARAYLESGAHADWHAFRPLLVPKVRNGQELPPHADWIRNVFLPRKERALRDAERALERLSGRTGAWKQ